MSDQLSSRTTDSTAAVNPVQVDLAGDRTSSGAPSPTLLEVRDLRVNFHLQRSIVPAVQGMTFSVNAGQTIGIIGESGSGKSVTARAIMGLLPKKTAEVLGSVRFEGKELLDLSDREMRQHRGKNIVLVFQDPMRSLNPTMRIGTQIAEALHSHQKITRADAHKRVVELLQMVRIPSAEQRFHEYPHQLSGGMRQRVMIAMALSCGPKVMIADEPTTALDVTTQAQIMELLRELQRELNMAVVLISHDMGLAAMYTDEVAVMYAGRVVEQATTKRLFKHVRMPYTRALLDSIPSLDHPSLEPLSVIKGRPPDLSALPPGCPFSPRCHFAQHKCEESPILETTEDGDRFACWFPL
ncbi:MAG TPA: ABC transporter ATP-binding protein [Acidimicrobiales bacterium]|nr:ABC transporter ATP-binding protein [Acidimicrobiales bacterium]